jgi:hypothetical protein
LAWSALNSTAASCVGDSGAVWYSGVPTIPAAGRAALSALRGEDLEPLEAAA